MSDVIIQTTDWFPYYCEPVHVGVYMVRAKETIDRMGVGYAFWDGNMWHPQCTSINIAASYNPAWIRGAMYQNKEWRGVLK